MARKVLLPVLTVILIFILPIALVIATTIRFDQFIGPGHANCHGGTILSSTGWISLNSSSGQTVVKGETFTVTAEILLFNESKGLTVSVGFVTARGDNSIFNFNPPSFDEISLDGTSGNSTLISYSVTAPSTAGNYTLIADALDGGSGSGADTLKWVTGALNITVESALTNDLQTIIVIITISIGAGLAVVAVILIKKRS